MQGIKHLRSGVDSMVRLVEAAGSNIFHKSNIERWDDVCAEFAATNAAIVAATGDLIDVSFRCSICWCRRNHASAPEGFLDLEELLGLMLMSALQQAEECRGSPGLHG